MSNLKNMLDKSRQIIDFVIAENMPQNAVKKALANYKPQKQLHIIAIGKAAFTMATAALDFFVQNNIKVVNCVIITKYGHSQNFSTSSPVSTVSTKNSNMSSVKIFEAGHPISDENTIIATDYCINLAKTFTEDDELLFLVSGGGSALFEKPFVSLKIIQDITAQLLASGANIVDINIIRKRLSQVKAGRFAEIVAPAKIFAIVLSDVLGDSLESIASGPTTADSYTAEDALYLLKKYNIKLADKSYILQETPKNIDNVKTAVIGSVNTLCQSVAKISQKLGYTPHILTTGLNCEAAEAGRFLGAIAKDTQLGRNSFAKPCVIIAGGETVVTVKGKGKGGRNQELAFAAAQAISNLPNTVIFSLGSDGTDGPTDAAGGIITGETLDKLQKLEINFDEVLAQNDSYNALKQVDGLIITGPTGTNVNDVSVVICE
ncbi:MAG: DUF4147 domain-containing protein [Firmicutes bacterium]|nr:DUF4147 domain-containing protein [Bacillota bacterium]